MNSCYVSQRSPFCLTLRSIKGENFKKFRFFFLLLLGTMTIQSDERRRSPFAAHAHQATAKIINKNVYYSTLLFLAHLLLVLLLLRLLLLL